MYTFVVAYTNAYDNDLTQEIVTADTQEEAIWKHSKLADPCWDREAAGESLDDIERHMFDCDVLVSVIEIPVASAV